MIWQNPVAWAGLLALAVPIVIHLLSRHRARTQKFPTLRFVTVSRLVPTRRTKLSDVWLLVVRAGIIAAAVAALAQPVIWSGSERNRVRGVQRAIVLDTSASLGRVTSSGERAIDLARREAQRLASESGASLVIATSAPAGVVDGASRWLELQAGRRELVIVSDFQRGVIDASDIARIPADIGVRLAPIAVALRPDAPIEMVSRAGRVTVLAGTDESAAAAAALRAASTTSAPADSTDERSVAVVFAGFEGRANLVAESQPPNRVWMSEAMASLQRNVVLASVAPVDDVIERVAVGTVAGRSQLLFFSKAPAGSLASAALIAAASNALASSPVAGELEPEVSDDATLRRWERPSGTSAARGASDTESSDGRWLWLLALGLIAAETWMRRPR